MQDGRIIMFRNWYFILNQLIYEYDTKQSDCEVPVMLWEMQSTPSLPSLPDPLWSRVVAPDRVWSLGQVELNFVLTQNWSV